LTITDPTGKDPEATLNLNIQAMDKISQEGETVAESLSKKQSEYSEKVKIAQEREPSWYSEARKMSTDPRSIDALRRQLAKSNPDYAKAVQEQAATRQELESLQQKAIKSARKLKGAKTYLYKQGEELVKRIDTLEAREALTRAQARVGGSLYEIEKQIGEVKPKEWIPLKPTRGAGSTGNKKSAPFQRALSVGGRYGGRILLRAGGGVLSNLGVLTAGDDSTALFEIVMAAACKKGPYLCAAAGYFTLSLRAAEVRQTMIDNIRDMYPDDPRGERAEELIKMSCLYPSAACRW
jgi:hypothetical protein